MKQLETLHELDQLRLDLKRKERTGVAEIIYAGHKTIEQVIIAVSGILKTGGRPVISYVSNELLAVLKQQFGEALEQSIDGRTVVVSTHKRVTSASPYKVGILTAGSSDIGVAEEAKIVCQESGCEVVVAYDVGVAGIHRLTEPLRQMIQDSNCRVLIVVAGMDGALPSVVAGLVDLPVIGLPTSVGYGLGGGGIGALTTMLQSCAPGIAVVNIDNGVGAAAMAVKIIKQISLNQAHLP